MNLLEFLAKALADNEYDGLVNPDSECACLCNDLEPCCHINNGCYPGHISDADVDGEWLIWRMVDVDGEWTVTTGPRPKEQGQ